MREVPITLYSPCCAKRFTIYVTIDDSGAATEATAPDPQGGSKRYKRRHVHHARPKLKSPPATVKKKVKAGATAAIKKFLRGKPDGALGTEVTEAVKGWPDKNIYGALGTLAQNGAVKKEMRPWNGVKRVFYSLAPEIS